MKHILEHRLRLALAKARPDLSYVQIDALVRRIPIHSVTVDRNGVVQFGDEARAVEPLLPAIDRAKPFTLPTPARPENPPTREELASKLAAVPRGRTAEAEYAERARVREQHARAVLGDAYTPTKENP